mgnify:CR=1 FL=1
MGTVSEVTDLIPGVAQAKAAGRVGLWIAIFIVGAMGILALAQVISDPFGVQKRRLDQAVAAAVKAQGEAAVAQGQAAAQADAAGIAEKGAARETQTIIIREANRDAIQSAPGAGVRLDPALVSTGNRGLCRYAVYAGHPGCAEVRPADPAELPQAGPSGGPSTP